MPRREVGEQRAKLLVRALGRRMQVDRALRIAAFASMLARDRQLGRGQQPIDVGDRAPRDQRQRPAQPAREPGQQADDVLFDTHEMRLRGDFSEGPVDVEKQRAIRAQRRRRKALAARSDELGLSSSPLSLAEQGGILARVQPVFTSLRFGHAAYGQLSQLTAAEITQGAEDEAEMGAFRNLYQPQREANLRTRLDEYLRFGLEAGILEAS